MPRVVQNFWWARPTSMDATLRVERWFVVVDSF